MTAAPDLRERFAPRRYASQSAVDIEQARVAHLLAMTKGEGKRVGCVRERTETRRGVAKVRWVLDFGRQVTPRYLSTYRGVRFESRAVAEAYLTLIRHEVAKGRPVQDVVDEVGPQGGAGPAIEPMMGEWVERFRARVETGSKSGNSLRELERWTTPGERGYLTWWYGASLFTIDADSLDEWDLWMAQRGLGAKTRRNVMAGLHSFCTWAKQKRPSFEVPAFPWPQPDQYVPRILTLELQQRVIEAIPEARRGAYLAMARLGIRPNEAKVVRVEDWRGDDLRVHRGKKDRKVGGREGGTKKRGGAKLLPVPPDLRAWLEANVPAERRLADPRGLLFRNPDADNPAGEWSEAAMRRCWYAACEKVGVEVGLYEGTKHTLGTALTSAGVERRVIARIFGHADERSTDHYARIEPEVIRSALGRLPR